MQSRGPSPAPAPTFLPTPPPSPSHYPLFTHPTHPTPHIPDHPPLPTTIPDIPPSSPSHPTRIVHGFSGRRISFSKDFISSLHPTKKVATFQLGSSSSDGDSLKSRSIQDQRNESEEVFDDTDEEDEEEEDRSGSSIEDEDVEDDWEDDDDDEPRNSPTINQPTFQRVDSKPNLVSRRSLLTTLIQEKDRAAALQNAASRSIPEIRRWRTTFPNGPLGYSPKNALQGFAQNLAQGLAPASRARPIKITTSNTNSPALSPSITRRNMLSTEFTESLRKHLLWDRQVNRSALKRRHTAQDMTTKPQNLPGGVPTAPFIQSKGLKDDIWKYYCQLGLDGYHSTGW
ncbi:hypothetical protein E2P81_ATG10736 [Venturia nashicola]|uniref:DUF3295 domain-containing protein n=1 Tax=Venturia nashicola TaxID=86259 RepID=A0A4Z1NSA6_9PEZI|nr:hypothetical protein E6O75_ATG10403 [Venturia nashicola]TLD27448.1 hypothetical protein E2P81_ATG10736 [Venturia nashicola]